MSVSFNNIPANIRVPMFYAEVDNSQANSGSQTQRTLIIGQMTADGAGVANIPVISGGVGDAKAKGGPGSLLHLLAVAYNASDTFGEVWLLPLADDAQGLAAAGSVVVTAPPTESGVIYLYIAGQRITLSVTANDTAATIAAGLVAQINATTLLPVTAKVATADTGTVEITAKNKGLAGNEIDLRLNYKGTADGESTPAGLGLTLTQLSGGAVNPALDDALANLGDEPFDFIVCPYNDTTSLDSVKSLLNDSTGRWSWANQVYGHCFAAKSGSFGALSTFGSTRNSQHESVIGVYDSPTPAWLWAADYAGAAAVKLRADPGRPLQTVTLGYVLPPPHDSRFTLSERNTLLWDGISTFNVASDGTVALENVITTYQQNSFGEADDSYLEIETLFLLMYVLRTQKSVITSKFPRMKLGDDGGRYSPGSGVVTPKVIRAELVASYQEMEADGMVQDSEGFAEGLIVERDSTNVNRVNVLWPGRLINQFRALGLLAQFRL